MLGKIKVASGIALLIVLFIILFIINFLVKISANWSGSQYEFHFLADILNKDSKKTNDNIIQVNTMSTLSEYSGDLNEKIASLETKLNAIEIDGEATRVIGTTNQNFDLDELVRTANSKINKLKQNEPYSLQSVLNKYVTNNHVTNNVVTMSSNINNMKTQLNKINDNISKMSETNKYGM
jgi:hypothetical protein